MSKNRLFIALSFLCVTLSLTDCSCNRDRVTVASVVLEIPTSAKALSEKLDKEKFSAVVEHALNENKDFRFDPDDKQASVLRLSLVPFMDPGEKRTLILSATLASQPGEKEWRSFADVPLSNGGISGKDIGVAMSKVLVTLHQLKQGKKAASDEFLTIVTKAATSQTDDANSLLPAISLLGELNEQRAIEPLIQILSTTKSIAIGNACTVALGELKAANAIPAIINFAELKPAMMRRQAINAARQIATKEALEWLLVMAYGYEDDYVREEAKRAYEDVEKRLGLALND